MTNLSPLRRSARSGLLLKNVFVSLDVVTPILGGSSEPRTIDDVDVIRAATVRGHLRFSWRAGYWSRLEDHVRDARQEAEALCAALSLTGDLKKAVVEAAGLHDLGKAHPQWQAALPDRSGIPDALLETYP